MDPHAHVQAEFDELSRQQTIEDQQRQLIYGNHIVLMDTPDINLISSSSDPSAVVPVSTITEAPIAAAPMDAAIIPTVVSPEQAADPTGGDDCSWLDCNCCGDDSVGNDGCDCSGDCSCCTIM